jgi:hypothetical protein
MTDYWYDIKELEDGHLRVSLTADDVEVGSVVHADYDDAIGHAMGWINVMEAAENDG